MTDTQTYSRTELEQALIQQRDEWITAIRAKIGKGGDCDCIRCSAFRQVILALKSDDPNLLTMPIAKANPSAGIQNLVRSLVE